MQTTTNEQNLSEGARTMGAIRKLTDSDFYLLDGRGATFYPRARLDGSNRIVLPATVAEQVARETNARAVVLHSTMELLDSSPNLSDSPPEEELAVVVRGDEILGWMYDKNTRNVETALPDLYSDGAAALEGWYLRWETSLPPEAREELAVLLVEADDKLMDLD